MGTDDQRVRVGEPLDEIQPRSPSLTGIEVRCARIWTGDLARISSADMTYRAAGEGRLPRPIDHLGVPPDVVKVQMRIDDVIDSTRLHAGGL
jgi:hypothetical protein